VAHGGRGRDGGDEGVDLLAELLFGEAELLEVLGLVGPFLELDVPEAVDVDFGQRGVDQVGDVRDRGLAGFFERVEDVGTAVPGVDAVDEVEGVVVLVGSPFYNVVAGFLESGHNGLNATEDGRVWENLHVSGEMGTSNVGEGTYVAVTVVISDCQPTGRQL